MKKQNRFQTILIIALAFAIVFMSIGFATYSRVLNINGTATVKSSKWSVHFNPQSFQETSDSVEANTLTSGETSISFGVNLNKFNDKYEFDVNVINDGTIDAKLISITLGGLDENQKKYIDYKLTYDGIEYTSTTSNLNDLIAVQGTKPVNVIVQYKQPENYEDLPSDDVQLNLTAALNYEQA